MCHLITYRGKRIMSADVSFNTSILLEISSSPLKPHHFMKTPLSTDKAPAAIGPYSQGITVGNMVFTSGQLPIDPATGQFPSEDIKEQTRQSLLNVKAVLEAAGMTMDDVVKTTVLLADMGDFTAMNEVYSEFFTQPFPARSAFAVKDLPKGARVEIECMAGK